LIYWYIGPKVHEVDREELAVDGHIERPEVFFRETAFRTRLDASTQYSKMLSELGMDTARNKLIAEDVAKEAGNGGAPCLVLADRKSH
jgi:hypothetical protein